MARHLNSIMWIIYYSGICIGMILILITYPVNYDNTQDNSIIDISKYKPTIVIKVLGYSRFSSLYRALISLKEADYGLDNGGIPVYYSSP